MFCEAIYMSKKIFITDFLRNEKSYLANSRREKTPQKPNNWSLVQNLKPTKVEWFLNLADPTLNHL